MNLKLINKSEKISLKSIKSIFSVSHLLYFISPDFLWWFNLIWKGKFIHDLHDQNKMVLAGNQLFPCQGLALIFSGNVLFEFWHRKWEITLLPNLQFFISRHRPSRQQSSCSWPSTPPSSICEIWQYNYCSVVQIRNESNYQWCYINNQDASAQCQKMINLIWYLVQTKHLFFKVKQIKIHWCHRMDLNKL